MYQRLVEIDVARTFSRLNHGGAAVRKARNEHLKNRAAKVATMQARVRCLGLVFDTGLLNLGATLSSSPRKSTSSTMQLFIIQ